MFEDISKEQLSKYKRRAGFVGRMVKIYLPLWLFSLYIYFYPVGASQDTYFQFDVSRNYIILGVVLTLLIYYSLQRTVTVFDKADEMEITYVIVGSNEASPAELKISDMSPIGHALVGKKAGSTVTVEAPSGSFELDILKVERTKNK